MAAHICLILGDTDLDSDLVGSALRRVGSRFGSVEGVVSEIAEVGTEGRVIALAAVVESNSLQQVYDQSVNALKDAEIEIDEADSISLHIPLALLEDSKGADLDFSSLVGKTIKFDNFTIINKDGKVDYRLEGSNDNVDKYYISARRSDCDGHAVIRSSDDGLVCCHSDKTTAEEKLRELEERDAEDRSSSLVRLSNEIETTEGALSMPSIVKFDSSSQSSKMDKASEEFNVEGEGDSFELDEPGFNVVDSSSLGSFPISAVASEIQLRKLAASGEPEIVGPAMVTGVESGDRRMVHPSAFVSPRGGFNTRRLPLPYMFGDVRSEYHLDARLGGWIVSLEPIPVDDQNFNYAIFTKTKLVESEFGQEIYDRFERGEYRGVSADLDRTSAIELETGSVVDNGPIRIVTRARFMGMTAAMFPALEGAGLWLAGSERVLPVADSSDALVASGDSYSPEIQIVSDLKSIEKSS